jgi:hypothetical protein
MLDKPSANTYLKPKKAAQVFSGDNGENALNNWKSKMTERKNIQNHLASMVIFLYYFWLNRI